MAKETYHGANLDIAFDSFGGLVSRVNDLVHDSATVQVTTTLAATPNTNNGGVTVGNAHIEGEFSSNVIHTPTLTGGTLLGASDLTVTSNTTFDRNVNVTGTLNVASNTTLNGSNVHITANTTVRDRLNANVIMTPTLTGGTNAGVASNLTVASNTNFNQNVSISGELSTSSNATFGGANVYITANTTVRDRLTANTLEGNLAWTHITSKPSPKLDLTLTGDVTGTSNTTFTELGNATMSLNVHVVKQTVILGDDTEGDFVASIDAGDGIDLHETSNRRLEISHNRTSLIANTVTSLSGGGVINGIITTYDRYGHMQAFTTSTANLDLRYTQAGVRRLSNGSTFATTTGINGDISVLAGDGQNITASGSSLTVTSTDTLDDVVRRGSTTTRNATFGTVTGTFVGNGAGLTNLTSTNLTGTIQDARIPTNIVRDSRTVTVGNGLSGGGSLASNISVAVVPGAGILSNGTGVHVDAKNGLSANTTGLWVVPGAGVASNATGVHVIAGAGLVAANSSGVHVGAGSGITVNPTNVSVDSTVVRTSGAQTITGMKTFSEVTVTGTNGAAWGNYNGGRSYLSTLNGTATNASWLVSAQYSGNFTGGIQLRNDGNEIRLYAGSGWVGVSNTGALTANTISATSYSGNGAGLTNLNSNNLTGTIPDARLPSNIVRDTISINPGLGLSGGGNLSSSRTIAVTFATTAEATSGTNDNKSMTPLKTKQAIDSSNLVSYSAQTLTEAQQDTARSNISAIGTSPNGVVKPFPRGNLSVTNNSVPTGVYRYSTTETGGPPGVVHGVVWHTRRAVGGGEHQTMMVDSPVEMSGVMWARTRVTGGWTTWKKIAGAAEGGGTDETFFLSDNKVNSSYTIPTGRNAMSVGPIQVMDGAVVTIDSGTTWVIV